MSLQIESLREEHLEEAASLVCARYRALRARLPQLPSRYEGVGAILPLLSGLPEGTPGAVAIRGSRLVGFMSGFVIPEFLGKRCMYSPEWANAALLGESQPIYERLYAYLSEGWVSDGCFTHLVSILGHDAGAIQAWQWFGFGFAAVDGIRGLEPAVGVPAELEIRRAGPGEIGEALAFHQALERHMAAAPAFWIHEMEDLEAWMGEPGNALWLAYAGGEALGYMGIGHANPDACAIIQDEETASIVMAYTQQRARGAGVATALLNRSLEWARTAGYRVCAVDFEPMNYLAARYWMKRFEPVCYSLLRCIDERIGKS